MVFPEILSNRFLKFLDIPACLGKYSDFEGLADECTTNSYSEALERIKEQFNSLKAKKQNSFRLSSEQMEVLAWFGIAQKTGPISVLDFGGGIGHTYYLCKNFFGDQAIRRWIICELESKVKILSDLVEKENLDFVSDVENLNTDIDFVLISGTLQYTSEPFVILQKVLQLSPQYILILKTPYWEKTTRLTKQLSWKTQEGFSERQSYPFWLLNESDIMKLFEGRYKKLMDIPGRIMPVTKYGELKYRAILFEKIP